MTRQKHTIPHMLAACLLLVALVPESSHAQVKKDDFASVPCAPLGADTSHQNPIDLYRLVAACATASRYDIAVDAFATAGTYGKFDMARVSDESAYGILGSMKRLAFDVIPPANKAQFQSAAGHGFDDKTMHESICERMRRAGPPRYRPDYMLNHGLGAVLEAAGASSTTATAPFRTNFVPEEAWKQALADYFSCK